MKKIFALSIFIMFLGLTKAQENAPLVSTDGSLTVTSNVTYSNPYYYVVWIKEPFGNFLRTITMYGQTAKYYPDLAHWNSESAANKVNATTGATKSSSSPFSSVWNGKNQANTTIVPDGNYTVSIEMSSESYGSNSKYITTTFTKGPAAVTLNPTAVSPISNVTIRWQPANTGIKEIELSKLYSIYPNPAISTVYVNGPEIQEIELLTLNGKLILVSSERTLDINNLPRGFYLAKLKTKAGTFIKKIEKI